MDDFNNVQQELTEEQKKNPVSSGAVEWHDPLDKPVPEHDQPTGKLALASVLFGAAGLCMSCAAPAAALLGLTGLVCGIVSGIRHEDAKGLRITGIVLSSAALGVGFFSFIMHLVFENGSTTVNDFFKSYEEGIGL